MKKECKRCGCNITRLHGNCKVCKKCAKIHLSETNHAYWVRSGYSAIVARRRHEAKLKKIKGGDNI